jgi:hypothetical protein
VLVPYISPAEVLRVYKDLEKAVQHARRIRCALQGYDDDDDDGDDDVPHLGSESVLEALRLMGLFQPDSQSSAFMDMVNGCRPIALPSALKDVMGYTFTYRWGQLPPTDVQILCCSNNAAQAVHLVWASKCRSPGDFVL